MRILFVTDWPGDGGGVETYVTQVADALRRGGDDVRLLTSSVGGGPAVSDYVAYGARMQLPQTLLQIANPLAARAMRRAVAEFRPDVVHVSMFEMHLSPSVLAAVRSVPVVLNVAYYKPICPIGLKLLPDDARCTVEAGWVCRSNGCLSLPHWLRDQLRYGRVRAEVRRAAAVLTCSRFLRDELERAGIPALWAPWPVVPPGEAFRRAPADEPLYLFAGRLSREKGVEVLLRALALARSSGLEARVRLVGDGPLRGRLERLVGELGLRGVAELTGWLGREAVEQQLADAWALVAPSLWAEPLGLSALEALAHGVPVIASTGGGHSETVAHGVSGLLFPAGDVEALAECLAKVASDGIFPGRSVPDATVRDVRAAYDLERHVAWLRDVMAGVVG